MRSKNVCCRLVWCAVLTALLFSQACATKSRKAVDSNSDAVTGSKAGPAKEGTAQDAQSIEDRTLISVSKAIRQAHLTDLRDECLIYRFDPRASKDEYIVEVRENHSRAACGGDPQTEPRLFTVKVDKKTQKMSADEGSPEQFHPLQN